ncbi:DUF3768 domain-containing protein [Laribacter hongkongensis]|uniref:DUF3768 domain-containing protein n=1 Tax=Laribacter hongkongensis TaxID=168471 RepID=UPI001EFED8DE|nr:DUF3768 domain-containing protein [Laribacter hongkongensis]MCG9081578.1 DUF3768 domain-containing protein [Laribacter hongkongensis]
MDSVQTVLPEVSPPALRIRQLNDALRTSLGGGRWMLTAGFRALPPRQQVDLLQAVRAFDAFDAGNDPWGEHDFGAVEAGGVRVLTVMLAEEY